MSFDALFTLRLIYYCVRINWFWVRIAFAHMSVLLRDVFSVFTTQIYTFFSFFCSYSVVLFLSLLSYRSLVCFYFRIEHQHQRQRCFRISSLSASIMCGASFSSAFIVNGCQKERSVAQWIFMSIKLMFLFSWFKSN